MLPLFKVEVETKSNPDKSSHKVYWEWVDVNEKKNVAPPSFKHGKWKLFVDVASPEKVIASYEAGESEEAWKKLLAAAEAKGFKDTVSMTDKSSCKIDLQNGTLKIAARKITTDDGLAPEVKITYADKDDLIKTSFLLSLDTPKNLLDIARVFTELASTFGDQAGVAE